MPFSCGILILIWSMIHPWSKYQLFILIWKVQRTSMSFKSSLGLWRTLEVPDWGSASWYLDIVTGLWYNNGPIFGSLSLFWKCKEHPCPLSSHLGVWRMPEVPVWGLASWSWYEYGHWSLTHPWSKFWLSILIFKVQRTSSPLCTH